VLYIIGTSGSGKSTTAKGLASDNGSVIHLDTLLEKEAHKSPYFNKDFEHFLRNKGVDIDKARDATIDKKERWKAIDDIGDHVESYGKDCYKRGKRVVIEGAQMGDDTMFPDKTYFKDKPTITMKSNYISNSIRASRRDGDKLIDTAKTVLDPERKNWYNYINKNIDKINNLSHSTLFGNKHI
jgi:ABC-type dipeptide/oligopeptide/nickel transport system ATPase component